MKLFRHIALASILTASFFCSCSKEQNPVQGEEMRISYNVSIPETKAPVTADGVAINKVWYALYNTDGSLATKYAPVDFVGGNARCEVVMMRDRSYKIVFVAQHYSNEATSAYPIDAQNATIGLPTNPEANTDKFDLFYGTQDISSSTGSASGSIVLDRIVAMVNFISSDEDWSSASAQGVVPTHSSIELTGVSAGFSLREGRPIDTKANLQFAKSQIPEAKHVGAVFCIAEGEIGATINLYTSADQNAAPVKTLALTNVQTEINKKTNIVGGIVSGTDNI